MKRQKEEFGRTSFERTQFERLQRGLTGERSLVGDSYMEDPGMLRAYLEYYWPVSREQARYALESSRFFRELRGEPPIQIDRVIDAGSGPGPVAAACAEAGAREILLIDRSPLALDLALRELPARLRAVSPQTVLSILAADISRPDPAAMLLWGRADLVTFGHSLNELWAGSPDRVARIAELLEVYAQALSPGGHILVIEPSLLATSRDLIAVRNLLADRHWRISAPCPGRESLPCPVIAAGATHTCHEELPWKMPESVASLARTLSLEKDTLKMTWFLLSPPRALSPRADLQRDCSRYPGPADEADAPVFRVVSDPMLNKGGRVRRMLCGASGRFPLSVAAGSPEASASGFDALRRGDLVCVSGYQERENGWGVLPETRIELLGRKE